MDENRTECCIVVSNSNLFKNMFWFYTIFRYVSARKEIMLTMLIA